MTARILRNAVMLILAIVITLAGFEFWGRFGHALGVVLNMPSPSEQTAVPPKNDGTVFVNVLPPPKVTPPYIGLVPPPNTPAKPNCPPKSAKPCK